MEESLQIAREETAPCHVRLTVEVPREQVDEVFDRVEQEFLEQVKLPGFRPGKAPTNLLRKQYGKKIQARSTETLLQDMLVKALDQEGLKPETYPQIPEREELQTERGRAFSFVAEFDTPPEFELPDYSGIALADDGGQIEDEEVESTIEQIMRGRTTFEKVERPAEADDLLKASYRAVLDPAEQEEMPEAAKFILCNENGWLALREPEMLPGISQSLLGAEAGEKKEIKVEFPEDFFEKSLAGRTLPYEVEVHEVQGPNVPELTDEAAREFGAESADDVRQKVRVNLEQRAKQEKQERQRQQIVAALLDAVDFPVPPMVLAGETYSIMRQIYEERARSESEEALKEKQEEIRQQAETAARRYLRRNYILRRIADKENVRIEQNEVSDVIEALSRRHRVPAKKLLSQLQESGRMAELFDEIRNNKALDMLRIRLAGEENDQAE